MGGAAEASVEREDSHELQRLFRVMRETVTPSIISHRISTGSPAVALSVDIDGVDSSVIDKEREVFAAQARAAGKPDSIVEKMVEGRIRKFYEEVVLLKQVFVMDPDRTIEKVVADTAAEIGAPIEITGFVRMALGEGVDKGPEDDFAA
jgi:elongation factor Ts